MSSAVERVKATLGHLSPTEKYEYTRPGSSSVLSKEQREQYERDGFILVKGLVTTDNLKKYADRFVQFAKNELPKPDSMVMMRDVSLGKSREFGEEKITKIQEFHDDPVLFDYAKRPEILRYVECFTGPDIKSVSSMLINKPPNVGLSGRHPLHQDLHYFPFRPVNSMVCSWTAMERVNRENGCLTVMPGSHRCGVLLPHGYPDWEKDGGVNGMYHGIMGKFEGEKYYVEMEAGDTLFFHPLLIHGSGANRSKGYRKAISVHYASAHCYYIDVKGSPQEIIAEELSQIVGKKLGSNVSFQDVWRLKSRLVKGKPGTL